MRDPVRQRAAFLLSTQVSTSHGFDDPRRKPIGTSVGLPAPGKMAGSNVTRARVSGPDDVKPAAMSSLDRKSSLPGSCTTKVRGKIVQATTLDTPGPPATTTDR